MKTYNKIKAFTLIELAIVITIIGLLLSMVYLADNLVLSANARKQVADLLANKQYFLLFNDKFGSRPGDYDMASATLGCTAGTFPVGCNGNKNGTITTTTTAIVIGQGSEDLRAWQHLSLAKIVPQNYTGVYDGYLNSSGSKAHNGGVNIAQGVMPETEYFIHNATLTGLSPATVLRIQLKGVTFGFINISFYPEFLKMLDDKIDDGLPRAGLLQTTQVTACYNATTLQYDLSQQTALCYPAFILLPSVQ